MKQNRARNLIIYEIFMAALALVIVAILFIELTRPLTEAQKILLSNIDLSILVIFAIDYFYRLIKAKDKWHFVKGNIFDLIAIVPFDKVFRIAKLARLARFARLSRSTKFTRLLRFSKLARVFAFTKILKNAISGIFKTNGLIYVVLITIGIILLGALGIMQFEESLDNFGDALWWSLVTTTTVGYGDISPESTGGRILAGTLMIVGIGFLGMVTGSITTFFVDRLSRGQVKENLSIVDEQIEYVKRKLDDIENLNDEEWEYLVDTINVIRLSKKRYTENNLGEK